MSIYIYRSLYVYIEIYIYVSVCIYEREPRSSFTALRKAWHDTPDKWQYIGLFYTWQIYVNDLYVDIYIYRSFYVYIDTYIYRSLYVYIKKWRIPLAQPYVRHDTPDKWQHKGLLYTW